MIGGDSTPKPARIIFRPPDQHEIPADFEEATVHTYRRPLRSEARFLASHDDLGIMSFTNDLGLTESDTFHIAVSQAELADHRIQYIPAPCGASIFDEEGEEFATALFLGAPRHINGPNSTTDNKNQSPDATRYQPVRATLKVGAIATAVSALAGALGYSLDPDHFLLLAAPIGFATAASPFATNHTTRATTLVALFTLRESGRTENRIKNVDRLFRWLKRYRVPRAYRR